MPSILSADRCHLHWTMKIHFSKPVAQRMEHRSRSAVFIFWIDLNQPAERRTCHHPLVSIVSAFVLLIGDERMNLTPAHKRDMACLRATKIFLEEDPVLVIQSRQPRFGVVHRFTNNGVD